MIGMVAAVLGGALLLGVGVELVVHALMVEPVPLIACLALACGVLMSAVGASVLRCTVEVFHER